jgi:hypothetical protein
MQREENQTEGIVLDNNKKKDNNDMNDISVIVDKSNPKDQFIFENEMKKENAKARFCFNFSRDDFDTFIIRFRSFLDFKGLHSVWVTKLHDSLTDAKLDKIANDFSEVRGSFIKKDVLLPFNDVIYCIKGFVQH